jgi:hypothetical protein
MNDDGPIPCYYPLPDGGRCLQPARHDPEHADPEPDDDRTAP